MRKIFAIIICVCFTLCITGCSTSEKQEENLESTDVVDTNKETEAAKENEPTEDADNHNYLSDEEIEEFKIFYSLSVWQNVEGPQEPHFVLIEDGSKIAELTIHSYKDKEVMDYGPDCDILFCALHYGCYSAYNIINIEMENQTTYKIHAENIGMKFQDYEDLYVETCTFIINDSDIDDDIFELAVPELGCTETMYKKPYIEGAY